MTLIQVMIDAAQAGARCLMEDFAALPRLEVKQKRPADFVSAADLRAEQAIHDVLHRGSPGYGFLLEEGGARAGDRSDRRWLVDPLDGTTNFLHGIPHFCISIALEGPEGLLQALILDPNRDELFVAERGQGATLGGGPMRVSGRAALADAVLATGIPVANWIGQEHFLRQLGAVMPCCAGVRRFGSAALDLAWVAAGRYDAFWERGLAPWDVAAGGLLVLEAGGQVSDLGGGADWLEGRSIAASNGPLHGPLLSLVGAA